MSGGIASVRGRVRRAVRVLVERSLTLAVAESSTGGLLADLLTDIPGVSACFVGGVVAYDNRVKAALLGVPQTVLAGEGAVSAAVAGEMAEGVRRVLGADVGVAVTGIAGPGGGTPEKPVGLTFVAVADAAGPPAVERAVLAGARRQVKVAATRLAADLLLRRLSVAGAAGQAGRLDAGPRLGAKE